MEGDGLQQALALLPERVAAGLRQLGHLKNLAEVHLDLGRPVRFLTFNSASHNFRRGAVNGLEILPQELEAMLGHASLGRWTTDNRAGIEGTLHRLSKIVGPQGITEGVTLRIGRPIPGVCELVRDRLRQPQSLLLLGPPASGKTTALREICRILADEEGRRVVVVDSSDEIAGCSSVPDPAVGLWTRRLKVPLRDQQYEVMREAVQNHNPEVVVVDEFSTVQEAKAAASIRRRGVHLIGTAHGTGLTELVENPDLWVLVGGVETAAVSDQTAAMTGKKIVRQRTHPAVFDAVIEMLPEGWALIENVDNAVDTLLEGKRIDNFRRKLGFPSTAHGQAEPTSSHAPMPTTSLETLRAFISANGGLEKLRGPPLKEAAKLGNVSCKGCFEREDIIAALLNAYPDLV